MIPPAPDTGEDWQVVLERDAPSWPTGRVIASVDAATGTLLALEGPSPVETGRAWLMALHNGTAFGLVGRGLVVLLGAAPVYLGITGWLVWRRRRGVRPNWGMPG